MIEGLVTTIIPVYNRPTMLREAVQCVLNQRYRSIEIIIVDDGSTDQTTAVAQELSESCSDVKFIRIQNAGPGLAREAGRQIAQGEYIQYLDSDDLLHPNKLRAQVEALSANPHCGVAYCRQQYCDMDGNVLDPAWMKSGEVFKTMFPAMLTGRIWGTPVPLYRKAILDQSGPWLKLKNEEDWEYDCRVASLGVELIYIDETLVTIRTHTANHYGLISNDIEKLSDRASAHRLIYQHADNAGIPHDCAEFLYFVRSLFLLSRQCGAAGLTSDSRELFKLVSQHRGATSSQRGKYLAYKALSALFGWKFMGRLSALTDKVRR